MSRPNHSVFDEAAGELWLDPEGQDSEHDPEQLLVGCKVLLLMRNTRSVPQTLKILFQEGRRNRILTF